MVSLQSVFSDMVYNTSYNCSIYQVSTSHHLPDYYEELIMKASLSSSFFWMPCKICTLTKGSSTLITQIGFLSCMKSLMHCKGWILTEGSSTLIAFISLLTFSSSLMFSRVPALADGLSTYTALIGLLSSMNIQMGIRRGSHREMFSTHHTLIRFLFSRDSPVLNRDEIFLKVFLPFLHSQGFLFQNAVSDAL